MKNRLQFNRITTLFKPDKDMVSGSTTIVKSGREKAMEYLSEYVGGREFIPLIGEPIVVRYIDDYGNKQLILAVGKATGKTSADTVGIEYHSIDTALMEEEISAATESAVTALDLASAATKDVANYLVILKNMILSGIGLSDGTYFDTDDPSGCGFFKLIEGKGYNYISAATSMAEAEWMLDNALTEAVSWMLDLSGATISLSAGTVALEEAHAVTVEKLGALSGATENIKTKVENIISGAGFDSDGRFIHTHDHVYLDESNSLVENDSILDTTLADLSANTMAADSALDARITDLEGRKILGQDAIKVDGAEDKTISLKLSDNEKVLSQDIYGLKTTISLDYSSADEKIYLKGINGENLSAIDVKDFIKDGMIDTVKLFTPTQEWIDAHPEYSYANLEAGKPYLWITFNTESEKEPADVFIKLDSLVDIYTVSPLSEQYLDITDYVLSAKVDVENGLASYNYARSISAITDNIISAAGLNIGSQGSYVPHTEGTPIIENAGSLDQADVLLDHAIVALSAGTIQLSANTHNTIRSLSAGTIQLSADTKAAIATLSAGTIQLSADTKAAIATLSAGTMQLSADTHSAINNLSAVTTERIKELSAGTVHDIDQLSANTHYAIDKLSAGTIHDVNQLSANTHAVITNLSAVTTQKIDAVSASTTQFSSATVSEVSRVDGKIDALSAGTLQLSAVTAQLSANTSSALDALSEKIDNTNKVLVTGSSEFVGVTKETVIIEGVTTDRYTVAPTLPLADWNNISGYDPSNGNGLATAWEVKQYVHDGIDGDNIMVGDDGVDPELHGKIDFNTGGSLKYDTVHKAFVKTDNNMTLLDEAIGLEPDGEHAYPTGKTAACSVIANEDNVIDALIALDEQIGGLDKPNEAEQGKFVRTVTQDNGKIDEVRDVIRDTDIKITADTVSDTNVKEAWKLVNQQGTQLGSTIKIYKDSSLQNFYLGHVDDKLTDENPTTHESPTTAITQGTGDTALVYVMQLVDGNYKMAAVNIEDFLQEVEFQSGVTADPVTHIAHGVVDPASESYLTVGGAGFKFTGMDALSAGTIQLSADTKNTILALSAGTIQLSANTKNTIAALSASVITNKDNIASLSAGTIQLSADTKSTIAALSASVVTNKNNVTALSASVVTDRNNISAVSGSVVTNKNNITNLSGAAVTNKSNISSLSAGTLQLSANTAAAIAAAVASGTLESVAVAADGNNTKVTVKVGNTTKSGSAVVPYATNADTVDGYHIVVGSTGTDANTIYIL